MSTQETVVAYGASATALAITDPIISSGTLGLAGNLTGLAPVGREIGPAAAPMPNPNGHGALYWRAPIDGSVRVFQGSVTIDATSLTLGASPSVNFEVWRAPDNGNNSLNTESPAASLTLPDIVFSLVARIPIPLSGGPGLVGIQHFAGAQNFLDIPVSKGDYVAVQIKLTDVTPTLAIGSNISIAASLLFKNETAP